MRLSHLYVPAFVVALIIAALPLDILVSRADPTPKPGDGSSGTSQMAGGAGKFGATYTITDHNGMIINYTILSAAYKIEPGYTQMPPRAYRRCWKSITR